MESYEKEQPVAFGDLYRSAMPVRLRRASSASRAKNQERGRAASERRTALRSFEGRVHDLGRRTKDGFSAFDALLALLTSCLSPLSPLVFAKNLDAQRRNEELGRNAPEPLFALSKDGSTILDEGRRTGLQLLMLFSEDG